MIPALSAHRVTVTRHRVAHRQLRTFCAALYGIGDALGDAVEFVEWRRFIEPVWRFHNRALVSLLPLNHPSLLPGEDAETVARALRDIAIRRPDMVEHAQEIGSHLQDCRATTISPLNDALRPISGTTRARTLLVALADDDFALELEQHVADTYDGLELLASGAQRRGLSGLRRLGDLLLIGKLERLNRALLRAPLADLAIDVLQYNWVNDLTAVDAAGPSLHQLSNREPRNLGYVVVTESSTSVDAEPDSPNSPPTPGALRLTERVPFPRRDPWNAFASDSAMASGGLVVAMMLILAGPNRELMATLLNEDGRVPVIRAGASCASEINVREVVPGDLYVRHHEPADQSAIAALGEQRLREQGLADSAIALQHEWKARLKSRIHDEGLAEVTSQIAASCGDWRPDEQNILDWAGDDTIGPQRKLAFRAVCAAIGISEHRAGEHWKMMKEIHSSRINAGGQLNARMLERVVLAYQRGELPLNRASTRTADGRATTVYPVELVGVQPREVPRRWLQREPAPVDPLDLDSVMGV